MIPASQLEDSTRRKYALVGATVIAASLWIVGCSATRPPTAVLSDAELDIRAADEAKADEFAPVDLKRARDKLARARQAMAAAQYEEARRFAESARVDAELAEAKAEARFMRRAADQILRKAGAAPSQAELDSRTSPSKPPTTK